MEFRPVVKSPYNKLAQEYLQTNQEPEEVQVHLKIQNSEQSRGSFLYQSMMNVRTTRVMSSSNRNYNSNIIEHFERIIIDE